MTQSFWKESDRKIVQSNANEEKRLRPKNCYRGQLWNLRDFFVRIHPG